MARDLTILKNSIFSYREESTRGSAESDSDNTAIVLVRTDTVPTWNDGRELLETQYMNGVLGRSAPQAGMSNEDIGFMVPVFARGSGTQGTAPDYSLLLKHTMGSVNTNAAGTIAASPAPTTTTFTATGGSSFAVGQIIRIEYATDTYAYRRITNVATTTALTVWPPLPAEPATGGDVNQSVSHILKSEYADFSTGTGYFYYDGDKRDIYKGCMGSNLAINLEVGKFIDMQFQMQALDYDYDVSAIGYTVVPSDYNTTNPLKCLSLSLDIYYAATVVTGSTDTSVILTSTGGVEVSTSDQIIVYVAAASDYETRTPSNVSGTGVGNKTCTVSALSGAPAAGAAAYIKHTECIPACSITIENQLNKDKCMHPDSGYADQSLTNRMVNVSMDGTRWRTILERTMRDNTIGFEFWAVAGSTAGNIFALCMPNLYYTDLPRGDDNGKITQAQNAMAVVSSGNDEILISHM